MKPNKNEWDRKKTDLHVLVLVLDLELPMAPVGPLREYHPPIVLHTSILTPLSSSIMWEVPVPLCTYARIGEDAQFR
jgi:hypothetical protein